LPPKQIGNGYQTQEHRQNNPPRLNRIKHILLLVR
jgi:hypothetical protein